MSDSNAGSDPNNEWDDRGEVAWNEFDWERYLRDADTEVERYLRFYDAHPYPADRIDDVAEQMQWAETVWSDDDDDDTDDEDDSEPEVYTLHQNPIYITTRAIHLSLARSWEKLAADPARVPAPLALALQRALHRSEDQAMQAVHALDFGDYAMAVSLFKRALSALNGTFALLNADSTVRLAQASAWREESLSRLFDLREVWLRVIAECREELERPNEAEGGE